VGTRRWGKGKEAAAAAATGREIQFSPGASVEMDDYTCIFTTTA
jgi:hypothetical protein